MIYSAQCAPRLSKVGGRHVAPALYPCYSRGMDKEWTLRITGPHCGTITLHAMTYAEAQAEATRLAGNRHARVIEIVRAR